MACLRCLRSYYHVNKMLQEEKWHNNKDCVAHFEMCKGSSDSSVLIEFAI